MFSLFLVSHLKAQKFEPKDGECLVFIGQDLEAIGGLDDYQEGYADFFETPAGVTVYTNLSPGGESYGYYNRGLDGITTKPIGAPVIAGLISIYKMLPFRIVPSQSVCLWLITKKK